jgi:hypothetical protein
VRPSSKLGAIVRALRVNTPFGGLVESVWTVDTPLFFPTDMLAPPRACSAGLRTRGIVLYRKIESTSFMQVFRRKVVISEMSPPTLLRTALGVIAVRGDLG